MRAIDLTGQVFGRLTVRRRLENTLASGTSWECTCECGAVRAVSGVALREGKSRSCGCLKSEGNVARSTKHGHSPMHGKNSPTYYSWASMLQRCTNPRNRAHARYGGRGITVCARWRDFRNFLADMGEKPAGHRMSIERLNNDGNYEPKNCVWANDGTQARNKSSNVRVTWKGETMLACEWDERLGFPRGLVRQRLHIGYDAEKALTKPVDNSRGRAKLKAARSKS